MTLQLTHRPDKHLELAWDGLLLFRYVYRPEIPRDESPKPYFHPIHSLAGDVLTNFRPHDHLWHHGLYMAMTDINGHNFWGGGTYVQGQGYKHLENFGCIEHQEWLVLDAGPAVFRGVESLVWIGHDGEPVLTEKRILSVPQVDPIEQVWHLTYQSELTNVRDEPLEFTSPAIKGRELAGYGGLTWRGPRSFNDGTILQAGTDIPEDYPKEGFQGMGLSAPWLAYIGKHDGTNTSSTLIFVDHPSNPRYPNKWFVLKTWVAAACFAFMFDEALTLNEASTLRLEYEILFANGSRSRDWIEDRVAGLLLTQNPVEG